MSLTKRTLRGGLQYLAAHLGRHARQTNTPQLVILMYHRILPNSDVRLAIEEPGMVVSPDTFTTNIEVLSEHFEFISLSEWVERRSLGYSLPKKACAITFDDGWSDNYDYAYPILQQYKVPATIYLVAGMIGTKSMFWPERLARTLSAIATTLPNQWSNPLLSWVKTSSTDYTFSDSPPTRDELSQIIRQAKIHSDETIHKYIDNIQNELGLNIDCDRPSLLNWDEINEMIASGYVSIGSHTCFHTRLSANTGNNILEKEIINSKNIIEQNIHRPINSFCFPNGDYTDAALNLVRQHYKSSVTTSIGWNSQATDLHQLRRIGVHEDIGKNKNSFLARVSNWI